MPPGKTRIGIYFDQDLGTQTVVTPGTPFPVSIATGSSNSVTANIDTVTSDNLIKATGLTLYELTMNTIGTWMPLTLTAKSYGYTIDCRADTITNAPPDLDMAMTATGTPFNRILAGANYYDDNIVLATNTTFYFRINEITNSVVQIASKE